MALVLLSDRQYTAPSAATSVSVIPAAVSWGNSAYVTLLDPTPAACVLTGVVVSTTYGEAISVNHGFEVDIATGAAGAEVVIATVKGWNDRGSSAQAGPSCGCVLPIPIDNIGAGVRIAARMRKAGTNTTAYKVAITYLQKPLTSTILTTAVAPTTIPAATDGVTLTAGSPAFTNGAWVQLRAASGPALVILGVVYGSPSVEGTFLIDLGIGAPGAESVVTGVIGLTGTWVFPAWSMLPTPLDAVPAATRLAARLQASTASATLVFSLMALERPL